eukprot:Gregarina_sp_Poly_1__5303@NODE_2802_length_1700_cov_99_292100_g1765_i0_p1_GENE_NODE_2802_length_1700_cov_99_292100_g1765_i0NODE_2802_length_1700_cov_99_292100_g1765_i0_p1_ORF_typecomplete_len157_score7_05NDUF_B6/PF09782_9/0_24_NODE_2802_length_1700_cov_99_292100_g1765_i0168638
MFVHTGGTMKFFRLTMLLTSAQRLREFWNRDLQLHDEPTTVPMLSTANKSSSEFGSSVTEKLMIHQLEGSIRRKRAIQQGLLLADCECRLPWRHISLRTVAALREMEGPQAINTILLGKGETLPSIFNATALAKCKDGIRGGVFDYAARLELSSTN